MNQTLKTVGFEGPGWPGGPAGRGNPKCQYKLELSITE